MQGDFSQSLSRIKVLGIGLVLFFMLLTSESLVAAFPTIEIELGLNKTYDKYFVKGDMHFNKSGHRVLSEFASKIISAN